MTALMARAEKGRKGEKSEVFTPALSLPCQGEGKGSVHQRAQYLPTVGPRQGEEMSVAMSPLGEGNAA
jgi:hypothetical protein